MARTVVGLFNSVSEAHQAITQLLAAGFQRSSLNLATPDTLQAEHLPAAPDQPTEPLTEGLIRFFSEVFSGNENPGDAPAHVAAAGPGSAVITVNAATEVDADRARTTLDQYGAVDVYKQAAGPATRAGRADDIVDLEGSLSRVRDSDGLDANGLTTHQP